MFSAKGHFHFFTALLYKTTGLPTLSRMSAAGKDKQPSDNFSLFFEMKKFADDDDNVPDYKKYEAFIVGMFRQKPDNPPNPFSRLPEAVLEIISRLVYNGKTFAEFLQAQQRDLYVCSMHELQHMHGDTASSGMGVKRGFPSIGTDDIGFEYEMYKPSTYKDGKMSLTVEQNLKTPAGTPTRVLTWTLHLDCNSMPLFVRTSRSQHEMQISASAITFETNAATHADFLGMSKDQLSAMLAFKAISGRIVNDNFSFVTEDGRGASFNIKAVWQDNRSLSSWRRFTVGQRVLVVEPFKRYKPFATKAYGILVDIRMNGQAHFFVRLEDDAAVKQTLLANQTKPRFKPFGENLQCKYCDIRPA